MCKQNILSKYTCIMLWYRYTCEVVFKGLYIIDASFEMEKKINKNSVYK